MERKSKSGPFKMKGNPMKRNFGASPAKKTGGDKTTNKPDSMWGLMSKDNTKMINEKGNWVNITKNTEGAASYKRYQESKKKKSPTKAGQTAGQIVRRERHMV